MGNAGGLLKDGFDGALNAGATDVGPGAHTFGFTGPALKNSARRDCMSWRASEAIVGSGCGIACGLRSLPSRRSRTALITSPWIRPESLKRTSALVGWTFT